MFTASLELLRPRLDLSSVDCKKRPEDSEVKNKVCYISKQKVLYHNSLLLLKVEIALNGSSDNGGRGINDDPPHGRCLHVLVFPFSPPPSILLLFSHSRYLSSIYVLVYVSSRSSSRCSDSVCQPSLHLYLLPPSYSSLSVLPETVRYFTCINHITSIPPNKPLFYSVHFIHYKYLLFHNTIDTTTCSFKAVIIYTV